MTTFYFSGIDRQSFIELLAREGAAGLVSWKYATSKALLSAYARYPEVKIVIDSGFLDKPTNEQYLEVILKLGDRVEWFGNNDVIGNQDASDENYNWLSQALPEHLKSKLLWIYQDGSMEYLAKKAMHYKLIGIGGLVPLIKEDKGRALDKINRLGRVLEGVGAKAHLFGVSSPDIILNIRGKSWFASTDSQSWIAGFKALELIRNDGVRVKSSEVGFFLTGEECAAQNIRAIHSWFNSSFSQLAFMEMR